jgi:predicted CopG family antitoxin
VSEKKLDIFIHLAYNFMKIARREEMANLQIKGMDDELYKELKRIAAEENRSISQQTVFLIRDYIAKKQKVRATKTPAQVLLELTGSWKDDRDTVEIVSEIRKARKNLKKLKRGF